MTLSSFLIRIILLVMPGIVGSIFYRSIRGKGSKKDWEDYLEILAFSLTSYGAYGLLLYVLHYFHSVEDPFGAFKALTTETLPLNYAIGRAIVFSSLLSIPIAFAISYVHEYKLINRFARFIGASKRFGDEDVWDYMNRSPDVNGFTSRT